jgi:hypothetical protein
MKECEMTRPELVDIGANHFVSCHRFTRKGQG